MQTREGVEWVEGSKIDVIGDGDQMLIKPMQNLIWVVGLFV